jgi:hypothetical protein
VLEGRSDEKSDVYSFALILYEVLTLTRVFSDDPRLRNASSVMLAVCLKLLARSSPLPSCYQSCKCLIYSGGVWNTTDDA